MGRKTAVLVIDMLRDFVVGTLKCDRARRIVPNIQRLIKSARERNIPIIYVNDSHPPDDEEFDLWGAHAVAGTEGAKVVEELTPKNGDHVVEKRRYSGFFETDLDALLRKLEVNAVILTGIHSNLCVMSTAADAFFRGYSVVVPEDCVEALSEEDRRSGVGYMRKFYGAEITRSTDLFK